MKKVSPVAAALLLLTTSSIAQGWVNVTPSSPSQYGPTVIYGDTANIGYDPLRGETVYFRDRHIWTWDGQSWSTSPQIQFTYNNLTWEPQSYGKCEWDPSLGMMVVLYEATYTNQFNQTQYHRGTATWDGTTFSRIASSPNGGGGGSSGSHRSNRLIYAHNENKLYCLSNNCGGNSQCWELFTLNTTTGQWSQINQPIIEPSIQANNGGFDIYYDWSQQCIALLQFFSNNSIPEYWEFTNGQWAQYYPNFPTSWTYMPQEGGASLEGRALRVYLDMDSNLQQPRLWTVSSRQVQQTYLTTWPAMRRNCAFGYDPTRDRIIMHGGGSNWRDTWELDLGPNALFTTYGVGCPNSTNITPQIAAQTGTAPSVNSQFNIQVSGLPFNGQAFMWLGYSNTTYAGLALPFNLALLGAPQCDVLMSPDQLFAIPNVLGTSVWTLGIPNIPGFTFYNQAIAFDPAANSLGLVFSNASESVVGQ